MLEMTCTYKENAMSVRKTLLSLITLTFILFIPITVHAETYILCLGCGGTGTCELCDPAKGSDRLGNGYMQCWLCHQTGYATCGTNHTGDGTPIGCDGSGYMPDGTVCPTCNGEGRYPCDVCNGTGMFECKCRQLGIPGKCHLCYGTGWRLINSSGVCYNTTPVYPSNGSTIDTSNFGYMGTMTYDAGRYGLGITAAQFEAIKDGSSGNNNSEGNAPQPAPDNDPADPNPPGSGPSDNNPSNPEGNPPESLPDTPSSFMTEPGSDSDIKNEIASGQDEICFICRYVAGEYLFSVKAYMSQMSDSELDIIHGMTETSINDFRGHLEAAANGIEFSDISAGTDSIRLEFGCGRIEYFPFGCEVLIEVPLTYGHNPCNLYYVEGGTYYSVPVCPVRNVDSSGEHEYLIFTIDRFGEFTDQETESTGMLPPDATHVGSDSPSSDRIADSPTSVTDAGYTQAAGNDTAPADESDKLGSHTPAIIIVLIAVCACSGGVYYLKKKK